MAEPGDRAAGCGTGPDATEVEPSSAGQSSADKDADKIAIPIGSPVSGDELRDLKRRAEQPDPSAEEMPGDEDASSSEA